MWKLTFEEKQIMTELVIWHDKNNLPVRNAVVEGSLLIKNGNVLNEFKPISEITQNDNWLCIFKVGTREFKLEKPGW